MFTNVLKCLFLFLVIATTTEIWAQCMQPYNEVINCQSSGCNQNVTITLPRSSEYGLFLQAGYVGCCNQLIQSYYLITSGCETAKLKEPRIRKIILTTLDAQHLLVANCNGLYFPLRPDQLRIGPSPDWNAASSLNRASLHLAR